MSKKYGIFAYHIMYIEKYINDSYSCVQYSCSVYFIFFSDGLDGWQKMQSQGKVGGQHNNSHYNNHHFNHHYNHNNHISPSRNHHYRQRRHGGNNLHHSPNDGFDVYNEWTPSKQLQDSTERNRRKGKFMRYGNF